MVARAEQIPLSESRIVTDAVLKVAKHLGLSNKILGVVIGLSEPSVSRMGHGTLEVARGKKPFEHSVLLIRLYRSLDAIVGGDDHVARQWLRNENIALHAVPLDLIQTTTGLIDVIAYLDSRRAVV